MTPERLARFIPSLTRAPRLENALGHEDAFPPPRLSAGFGFRKETIAGMRLNGRDAP